MKPKNKNYITKDGLQRLFDEQEYLLKEERPKVTRVVTWAASLGDRSENADYQYGKKRLREIDRRLRFLAKRIDDAYVVEPKDISSKVVQFSATVTVENEENLKRVFCIVGVDETNMKKSYISWLSPIGRALLGKSLNDEVEVVTPKGTVEYKIIDISYINIPMEKWKCE